MNGHARRCGGRHGGREYTTLDADIVQRFRRSMTYDFLYPYLDLPGYERAVWLNVHEPPARTKQP